MIKIYAFLFFILFAVSCERATIRPTPKPERTNIANVQKSENEFSGKIVGIADGDTATVIDDSNTQHKIRLMGIDAPEKSQAFGQNSKRNLSDLIFGKIVVVQVIKRDRYNREVAKVLLDGKDVNLQQVKDGFAWHYKE